jgi:predicted membrane-bound mannosyltransferase
VERRKRTGDIVSMMNSSSSGRRLRTSHRAFWVGLVFIFLLALLPRLFYPVMREMLWYKRSVRFWDALLAGDLGGTYQRYHPGVTAMWTAGLGLEVYAAIHGWSGDDLLEPPPSPSGGVDYPIDAGVAALGIAIAACIGLTYVLLIRLTDWPVAFSGGCLLALDPFYIYLSKMIHLDALLASFMLVSVLFLLCYLQQRRRPDLVFSGVFAGLAFLTKSPSGVLLPYAVLVAVSASFSPLRSVRGRVVGGAENGRRWARSLWNVVRTLGVWGVVAGFIFVLLWPAMWLTPFETLSKVVQEALFRVETPHHDNFFAGQITEDDPGWLFYVATVAWKTTLITLPAICAAAYFLFRRWREKSSRAMRWIAIYAGSFFLMMVLAAKKGERYLLPTFLALDVLAAWGLILTARAIGKHRQLQRLAWVPAAIATTALVVQAGTVFRHHPYYSTHHNLLLGGSQVAQHILPLGEHGEGLDLAAQFLNGYPGAEQRVAGLQKRFIDSFRLDFVGRTRPVSEPDVDYLVFAINANQRELNADEWEEMWEACQKEGPLWSVSFDSVPYAWICPAYPSNSEMFAIDDHSDIQLGDHIKLLGYQLSATQLSAQDALTVTLFWQSDGRLVEDYHVFVHLLDADGQMVVQHDGVPVQGERPTWDWRDREVLQDEHVLAIDEGVPPGTCTLSVGMYDYQTQARLPATGPDGQALPDGQIVLSDIQVALP